MAAPRRVGTETSKTRDVLLDCVEQLMLEEGYPGVTYRAIAAKAGVTSGLVQYYFPTRDELFVAAIRRRSEQNVERLTAALAAEPDRPLRVVWRFSGDESNAALTSEFLALGNHLPSIRAEIAHSTEQVRALQLDALRARYGDAGPGGDLTNPALVFLLTGIPRMVRLERSVGVSTAHGDVTTLLERYLDQVEPTGARKRRSPRRSLL